MKKYENGEYIELSDEEIELIEKEKDEYLISTSEKEETVNTADSIKETVTGKTLVLKDASSGMEKVVVKGTGVTSETKLFAVGQNVWNETCYLNSGTARLGSKNHIPVAPGVSYYFYCNSPLLSVEEYDIELFMGITYFDSNKNQLSVNAPRYARRDSAITMPEGCYYIKFELHEAYGHTYKNDICISVSNEKTNGTYAPYSKAEYSFDANGNAVIPAPIIPNMTLFTEDEGATLECEYRKDIKGAIADTVADAIANSVAGLKKDWELISSDTLTEGVSTISVTTDSEGNPFELEEIYALVKIPSPNNIAPYIYFTSGTTCYVSFGALGTPNSMLLVSWSRDKLCAKIEQYQYYNTFKTSKILEVPDNVVVDQFRMQLWTENAIFPVGTEIKVWGKKVQ